MISPVRTSVEEARRGHGLELLAGGDELVTQRVLHAKIEWQARSDFAVFGGQARHVQIRQAAAVQPFLDAGDALIVDIDVTDDVRELGAVR